MSLDNSGRHIDVSLFTSSIIFIKQREQIIIVKLVTPYSSKRSWIAISDDTDESDLVRRIRNSDIILSDLDKTDAFPCKDLVIDFLTDRRHAMDRKFWLWAIAMGKFVYQEGKEAINIMAASFTNCFLRDREELERIAKKYTPEYASQKFYQGVTDFYAELPDALKIYVTRNILNIAQPYAAAAHFHYVSSEQYNKEKSVDTIVAKFPDKKRYIVRGDSPEDEKMNQKLQEYQQQGTIQYAVYINVTGSYRRTNPRANVNTSRNQTALAAWVKGKPV